MECLIFWNVSCIWIILWSQDCNVYVKSHKVNLEKVQFVTLVQVRSMQNIEHRKCYTQTYFMHTQVQTFFNITTNGNGMFKKNEHNRKYEYIKYQNTTNIRP